jgi:hypothetical protein
MFIQKQPASLLFGALATLFFTGLLFSSCHEGTSMGGGKGGDSVCVPNPKDTSALGKINHRIPKSEIMNFRRAFNADSLNRKNPGLFITESEGFNKRQLLELLSNPDCVGIRIYYGIAKGEKRNELKMIIVGTNSQGKDLYLPGGSKAAARVTQTEDGLEYGQCCVGSAVE